MTLLDSQPPPPSRPIGRYLLVALVLAIAAVGATYYFWNHPEERALTRFLAAVQRGDYPQAYRLWQPSPSYSYADFLQDWGEKGDYGKIREYEILDASSKGSETVVLTVVINHESPPLKLLVDRKTKGLAYSPF